MTRMHTRILPLLGVFGLLLTADVPAQQQKPDLSNIRVTQLSEINSRNIASKSASTKTGALARMGKLATFAAPAISAMSTQALSSAVEKNPLFRVDDKGRVLVDIITNTNTTRLTTALKKLGFESTGALGRTVSGWLPTNKIEAAALLPDLQFARPSIAIAWVGNVTSQADPAMPGQLIV
ncbi:hypothetical protein ACFL17_06755 [Pseudomonadota bacterium]